VAFMAKSQPAWGHSFKVDNPSNACSDLFRGAP
jgi:hypothetical protein